jgi:kynurenine formamidase
MEEGAGARVVASLLAAGLGLACAATPPRFPAGRLVDLTHPFDAETIFWPTEEGFVLEPGFHGHTERGYYYEANRFRSAEHGGTHVDAPIHFFPNRDTVDRIPLERLVGEGVLVDVSAACAADRDHRIGIEDLAASEAADGAIPKGAIVLLRTGFGERWPDREQYLGTAARGAGAVAQLHFPGLDPAAARWLALERRISAVGIDTASIDPGQSADFESHQLLFEHGVPAFENLANLSGLPARGFLVIALPMKIRGGSGGPLRALAVVP